MIDYHPDGSLAPRDIVARGIHQMMHETGSPCAYLDISHKPAGVGPAAVPDHRRQVPRGRLRPDEPSRSRSCRRRTTAAAASPWTARASPACAGCARSARCRARGCTARTGWRARRCSSASSGARAPARRPRGCVPVRRRRLLPRDRALAVRDRAGRPGAHRAGLAHDPPDDVELRRAGAEPPAPRPGARDPPGAAHGDRPVLRAGRARATASSACATACRRRWWCCWRRWSRGRAGGAITGRTDRNSEPQAGRESTAGREPTGYGLRATGYLQATGYRPCLAVTRETDRSLSADSATLARPGARTLCNRLHLRLAGNQGQPPSPTGTGLPRPRRPQHR